MLSIIILSVVMAVVTLVAGLLPLLFPGKLDTALLSQFGTGVLLGSTFLVVIPEAYEQIGFGRFSWLAGISVVAGFLLMLAIDVILLQKKGSETSELDGGEEDSELMVTPPKAVTLQDPRTWFSGISFTTFGLTVHAAADGIALGATSGDTSNKLELLVFFSILVHKAPAALSLCSILMAHKNPPSTTQIKRDIVLFSLAGPVCAVTLGWIISLLNWTSGTNIISGVCLAVSGGTFLFVATHILEHARNTKDIWKAFGMIMCGTVCPLIASLIPE